MGAFLEKVQSVFREWEIQYRAEIGQAKEPDADTRVSMVQNIIAFMALDGPTPRTFERIQNFLDDQLSYVGVPICLSFWGGVHHGAAMHVRDLQDFDFADTWLMDGFDLVCATRTTWSPMEIGQFLAVVQKDFVHDGIKARVWILDEHGKEVCLGIHIIDATLGAFRLARAMGNEKVLSQT